MGVDAKGQLLTVWSSSKCVLFPDTLSKLYHGGTEKFKVGIMCNGRIPRTIKTCLKNRNCVFHN